MEPKNKFQFRELPQHDDVKTDYIQMVTDCYGKLPSKEFIEKLLKKYTGPNLQGMYHAQILTQEDNLIVLETSKFSKVFHKYMNHTLWVFHQIRGQWDLHRYFKVPAN